MADPETELLFPPRLIPALRELRGPAWRELVDTVIAAGPDSPEQVGFILVMARIVNCETCNSDSYRAMNGCLSCARQTLKRCRETDEALAGMVRAAKGEVEQYLKKD